jgi:hypothetical protein
MEEDFPLDALKVSDTSRYTRGGDVVKLRVYTFYLGKHGPFTVELPLEGLDESEIGRRIESYRRHLRELARL